MYKKTTTTTIEESDMPINGMSDMNHVPENTKKYIPCIRVDAPLLIKLFEYASEDATTDMDIHTVVEMMMKESSDGSVLTMNEYSEIVPHKGDTAVTVTM